MRVKTAHIVLLGQPDQPRRVPEQVRQRQTRHPVAFLRRSVALLLLSSGSGGLFGPLQDRGGEGGRSERFGREAVSLVAPDVVDFFLVDAAVVQVLVDCPPQRSVQRARSVSVSLFREDAHARDNSDSNGGRTLSLFIDDESAPDRKVLVRRHQCPVLVKYGESHPVRVSGERVHAPEHVAVVRVGDRVPTVEFEPTRLEDRVVPGPDRRGSVNRVGGMFNSMSAWEQNSKGRLTRSFRGHFLPSPS